MLINFPYKFLKHKAFFRVWLGARPGVAITPEYFNDISSIECWMGSAMELGPFVAMMATCQ